ncbi:MAG: hypothetical protein E7213_07380 [Clostridium sp.]|nr:hypothetical protein [Clostridium sp.]
MISDVKSILSVEKKITALRTSACGATKGMLVIDAYGDIYACYEEIDCKENRIGYVDLDKEEIIYKKLLLEEDNVKDSNGGMWFKIILLNEKVIGKLGRLSVLFNKKISVINLVVAISSFIYLMSCTNLMDYKSISINSLNGINYIIAIVIGTLGVFFHELGHITASKLYGSVPKSLGVGIYFISPVIFVDVDDSWKLKKNQRVIVDLGGVYFQVVYSTLLLFIYFLNYNPVFIILYFMFMTSVIFNLNPFLKYDGYWFLSDLLGVYNLNKKFPIVIRSCIKWIFGKKESFNNLREVWKNNVLITIFLYGLVSIIFYIFFSFKIVMYILSNINVINKLNLLSLVLLILFVFIGVKSIIALIKLILQIFVGKDEIM